MLARRLLSLVAALVLACAGTQAHAYARPLLPVAPAHPALATFAHPCAAESALPARASLSETVPGQSAAVSHDCTKENWHPPLKCAAGEHEYANGNPYRFTDPDGRKANSEPEANTCSRAGGNSCSGSYVRSNGSASDGGGDEATEIANEVRRDFGRQAAAAKDVADGASAVADVIDDQATDTLKYGIFGRFVGPVVRLLARFGIGKSAVRGAAAAADTNFKTAHYAARLEAVGVSVARAETAVAKEVNAMRGGLTTNADVVGRLTVDGVKVEYRLRLLPDGTVNVGTLFPVK
jgi:hypothetical protein